MAKKTIGISTSGSLFDLVSSFDDSVEVLAESKTSKINDYIDTGWLILNACVSGSMFKGIPCGRVTTLAGPSGCGKSYLAISICRNAQKKGYTAIYLDSEAAIDDEFVERLGCDPSKFIIKKVSTISETSSFIANLCKRLEDVPEESREKVIIVLDSLSNLTSDKEYNDTVDGTQKRDMTKQQEVKALFRTNVTALGRLGIPMICTAHVYQTMDLFAKQVVSGGSGLIYSASLTLKMNAAKLDDKESDKIAASVAGTVTKTGTTVTVVPEKSRFTIPIKVKFTIPYYKAPNPYYGLNDYIDWDNTGILLGEILDAKKYAKLTPAEQAKCYEFTNKETGEVLYAHHKETSRKIVVRHLAKEVYLQDMYTPEVFNDELLQVMDEKLIKPVFQLPSQDSNADLEELFGKE